MSQPWSSPIALLEEIHQQQKNRICQLYHPMSSPTKRSMQYHHKAAPRGTGRRNKHEQMREIRDRHRNDRLVLQREKTTSSEDREKHIRELERQADEIGADMSRVIEDAAEEEELQGENQEEDENDYEAELEAYLAEQELELEQQLKDMNLGN